MSRSDKKNMVDEISKRLNLQQGPLTESEKYNPEQRRLDLMGTLFPSNLGGYIGSNRLNDIYKIFYPFYSNKEIDKIIKQVNRNRKKEFSRTSGGIPERAPSMEDAKDRSVGYFYSPGRYDVGATYLGTPQYPWWDFGNRMFGPEKAMSIRFENDGKRPVNKINKLEQLTNSKDRDDLTKHLMKNDYGTGNLARGYFEEEQSEKYPAHWFTVMHEVGHAKDHLAGNNSEQIAKKFPIVYDNVHQYPVSGYRKTEPTYFGTTAPEVTNGIASLAAGARNYYKKITGNALQPGSSEEKKLLSEILDKDDNEFINFIRENSDAFQNIDPIIRLKNVYNRSYEDDVYNATYKDNPKAKESNAAKFKDALINAAGLMVSKQNPYKTKYASAINCLKKLFT